MKNYYGIMARSLIALMFIVAGIEKLQNFSKFAGGLGAEGLGLPMPSIIAALVIFIEIVVAAAFAYGYKVREAGYVLIGFVLLTVLLVHNNMTQLGAALKNLAIVGGIMLAACCKDKHHG